MENSKLLVNFLSKISNIFTILKITENKDEMTKNLVGTSLVNFSRLFSTNEKTAPFLQDYSQVSDADPEKLFSFLDSKGIDYRSVFIQAQNETLQSFVNEVSSDLTSEKLEELNRIVSE
jgi:hypothetical protein